MDGKVDVEYVISEMSHIHAPKEFGRKYGVNIICVVSFSRTQLYNPT